MLFDAFAIVLQICAPPPMDYLNFHEKKKLAINVYRILTYGLFSSDSFGCAFDIVSKFEEWIAAFGLW